jgi:hypothetical protein
MRAAAGFGIQNRRNCSMPRPPLSGSTALTGMHARPTSRLARLNCVLPLPLLLCTLSHLTLCVLHVCLV